MEQVARLGVDLAKRVIQVHGVDNDGRTVLRRCLPRDRFVEFMVQLPPCVVAMEACGGAHHWARKLLVMGHVVKLIAAQFVTPYRKGGPSGKNDAADAEAICEAASRPSMRYVPAKSAQQQGIATLHRLRQGWVEERTAMGNRLRGLLAEFGLVMPLRMESLRQIPTMLEDADNEIPGIARLALMSGYEHLQELTHRISDIDRQIELLARSDSRAQRLMAIPGIGPITATAVVAAVGSAHEFKCSRQFAAWLGLTPRQRSSGGKTVLGSITKRGDAYVRMLLIRGAHAALLTAARRVDRVSQWVLGLNARLGWRKTLVALANKNARIIWALLTTGQAFDSNHISVDAAHAAST
jgi:transposase